MNSRKITLFLSGIFIVGVASLTGYLISSDGASNILSFKNQAANIGSESKEERIVNKKVTEILEQPLDLSENTSLEVEKFVQEIEDAKKEKNLVQDTPSVNVSTDNDKTNDETKIEENDEIIIDNKIENEINNEGSVNDSIESETAEENKKDENNKLQDTTLKPETPIISDIKASSNSLALNFNKVINATSYKCIYGKDIDAMNNEGTIIDTLTGYQCFIDNLEQGTNYYVQLIAINEELSSNSEIKNVKTSYLQPEVSTLISKVVSDNNIKVSYSLSNNATRYTCFYKETDTNEWNVSGNLVIDEKNIYCELSNLKENKEYEIKLTSINGDKEIDSEITTIKTNYKKPELPIVKNINTTKNSINIVLDKSKNATSYVCKYGITTDGINNFGNVVIEENNVTCSIKNLGSNSTYFVKLYAYNHDIYTESSIFEVTTNGLSELSTPVLTSTNSNSSEIDVIFNIYKGNPNEYNCSYGYNKNSLDKTGVIIENTNSQATCRLSELSEGTSYYVQLTAKNEDFEKKSEIYEVKTEFNSPTKSILENQTSTEDSITATFSKGINATEYLCYYGTNNSNINIPVDSYLEDKAVKCELKNLNEGTNYYLKVVSVNGDKQISSDIYTISTKFKTPSKPTIINQYQTQDSIKVDYSLSDYATDYEAYYGTNANNLVKIPFIKNEDSIEINVNNLKSETNYYFKLIASNKGVKSIESDLIEIRTLDKKIDAPILVSATSSESTITLNYNIIDNLDLYICYYGTDKDNLNNTTNAIRISDNTRQCVINDLDENKTYYFKLNVIKNNNIINSEINEIKTKFKTPSVPVIKETISTNSSIKADFNIGNNLTEYVCKIGTDINNINTTINSNKTGNVVSCNADNLLNKTNYYIQLTIINGDKSSQSDVISITTKYNAPTKPIWEKVIVSDNKITATYSLSNDTTDYICYYGTDKNNITKLGDAIVENNKVRCEFSNLNQNSKYFYKVVATNHNEVFTESDIKEISTSYSNPEVPVISEITSTESSITLTYPTSKNASSYVCKYGTSENNLTNQASVTNSANSIICEAKNLQDNTNYYFRLSAINGDKTVDSNIVKTTTKQKIVTPSLATPEYVGTGKIFNGAITIKFTEVADAYAQYCYYGTNKSNLSSRVKASWLDGNMVCSIPYDESKDLFVMSRAYEADGTTYTESKIQTIKSSVYIPEAPTVTNITKDFENIIMTYNTGGYSQGYKCYIGTDKNNITTEGNIGTYSNMQMCSFTGLKPNTTYFVRIDNIYDSEITSTITEVKTDALNSCVGNGASISNQNTYGVKVNSTCGVGAESDAALKAEAVAIKLASVDTLKVLKDYPQYDVKSFADIIPLYNSDRTIYGYDIDIVLYEPGDISMVIGEYYLRNNQRIWATELPYGVN